MYYCSMMRLVAKCAHGGHLGIFRKNKKTCINRTAIANMSQDIERIHQATSVHQVVTRLTDNCVGLYIINVRLAAILDFGQSFNRRA